MALSPVLPPGPFAKATLALALALSATGVPQTDLLQSLQPLAGNPHVIVIIVDGLRPDLISAERTPALQRLVDEGAATLEAQTVDPSVTLPSITSMLTGLRPRDHGVTWNDYQPGRGVVAARTIFDVAHDAGVRTAPAEVAGRRRSGYPMGVSRELHTVKKIVAIACLTLLTIGSAGVWASALCSSGHHMVTMVPAHDCPTAACCAVSAPLTADYPGKSRPETPATASSSAQARAATLSAADAAETGCPSARCGGSPQASPVLRL